MCLSLLLFASALVSCEEWTEPESKVFLKGDGHDDIQTKKFQYVVNLQA